MPSTRNNNIIVITDINRLFKFASINEKIIIFNSCGFNYFITINTCLKVGICFVNANNNTIQFVLMHVIKEKLPEVRIFNAVFVRATRNTYSKRYND